MYMDFRIGELQEAAELSKGMEVSPSTDSESVADREPVGEEEESNEEVTEEEEEGSSYEEESVSSGDESTATDVLPDTVSPPVMSFDPALNADLEKAVELADKVERGLLNIGTAADLLTGDDNYNLLASGEIVDDLSVRVKALSDNVQLAVELVGKMDKGLETLGNNIKETGRAIAGLERHIQASKSLAKEYTDQVEAFRRQVERAENAKVDVIGIDPNKTSLWQFFLTKVRNGIDIKINSNSNSKIERR